MCGEEGRDRRRNAGNFSVGGQNLVLFSNALCVRAEKRSRASGVTKRSRRPFGKKGIRMEKEFLPSEPCHHPVLEHFGRRCGGGILPGHVLGLPLPAEALLAQAHQGVTLSP